MVETRYMRHQAPWWSLRAGECTADDTPDGDGGDGGDDGDSGGGDWDDYVSR